MYYRNPWHKTNGDCGPALYKTEAEPMKYRGFLIYERIKGVVWDVVKDGECVTQRAGLNGAKEAIDQMCSQRRTRLTKRAAR